MFLWFRNSNKASYTMASKPCIDHEYKPCAGDNCGSLYNIRPSPCAREEGVKQFFMQDGEKIEPPAPHWEDLPDPEGGLTEDYCYARPVVFESLDLFNNVGGWHQHLDALRQPMVMALSIYDDVSIHQNHNVAWANYITSSDQTLTVIVLRIQLVAGRSLPN